MKNYEVCPYDSISFLEVNAITNKGLIMNKDLVIIIIIKQAKPIIVVDVVINNHMIICHH